MKINHPTNSFSQSKALFIAGLVIVALLIVLPLTVPRFLKPDVITVSLIPGLETLPLYLGLDKPVFLENRLELRIMPFEQEVERDQAFLSGNADLILCDLPAAILVSDQGEKGQIIRTVLRSNRLGQILDDRKNLMAMSVLVISKSIIRNKPQVLKRFLYAFEQTILELNYRPTRYTYILKEKGNLPEELKSSFPMPIYEGPNVPVESEMEKAEDWLIAKGLIAKRIPYLNIINLRFLPDPDHVARASCCL